MNTTPKYFLLFIFILLAACSPNATAVATPKPHPAIVTQAAGTVVTQVSRTAMPSPTLRPTPTNTPLPFVKVDGLRMVYVNKGNLYIQYSGGEPIQLTAKGLDRNPVFSDDGQKIVFYRGGIFSKHTYQVYRINADGSGEDALVTSALLTALNLGYDESTELRAMIFVPGTHKLLFNTEQFPPTALRGGDSKPKPNLDMLIVDTDNGKIKQLRAPSQVDGFGISPKGKLIWVGSADHTDVIDLDGKIVRKNLVVNPPILPGMLDLWSPILKWMQDGDKLFVIPLDPSLGARGNDGVPEPRTIWQYYLNGSTPVEVRLSPPVMGHMFKISPDENWVVYTFGDFAQETQETATPGIYLGNLRNGNTRLIGTAEAYELPLSPDAYDWSPDSTHFIFENYDDQIFMGDINGKVISLNAQRFSRWLDASRYLFGGAILGKIGEDTKKRIFDNADHFTEGTFLYINIP